MPQLTDTATTPIAIPLSLCFITPLPGRGRNWRSAPPPPPILDDTQEEEFAAPAMNDSSNLDFYQEDMGGGDMGNEDLNNGPDGDMKMEGGEVRVYSF